MLLPLCLAPPSLVLSIRDAASGKRVVLIGSMHYNPASAALAASTVRETAATTGVRSVLVELCPSRWNATDADAWNGAANREVLPSRLSGLAARVLGDEHFDAVRKQDPARLFRDEFQAAFVAARAVGAPFALADQPIELTKRRLAAQLAQVLLGSDLDPLHRLGAPQLRTTPILFCLRTHRPCGCRWAARGSAAGVLRLRMCCVPGGYGARAGRVSPPRCVSLRCSWARPSLCCAVPRPCGVGQERRRASAGARHLLPSRAPGAWGQAH